MKCCLSSQAAANVLFYFLVTAWMTIRIGQPGRYQQQSLCGDKLQLFHAQSVGASFSAHGSPLSENKAGFMAAGECGKHNGACNSLEFNVLSQETEYRSQKTSASKKNV